MFVQLVTICACIGAFVLQILGIVDNATTISNENTTGKYSSYKSNLVIIIRFFILLGFYVFMTGTKTTVSFEEQLGSVILYSFSAFFLLFSIVFSVSLLIRLTFVLCDVDQDSQRHGSRSMSDSTRTTSAGSSSSPPGGRLVRDPFRGYKYGPSYQEYYAHRY